jgi:PPP family 3-phenylpropionic acid transporter
LLLTSVPCCCGFEKARNCIGERDHASMCNSYKGFFLLYAAMYAAYGVASPFLPAFLSERGLQAEHLGLVLAAGTAIRLIASPTAARIADRLMALRTVLIVCIALAGGATLGYLPAYGLSWLLVLTLLHAAFLAPMTMLADALALGASKVARFEYGWVRGTGSAAFIAGLLVSGQSVGAFGLQAIAWSQACLLFAAALAGTLIPEIPHERAPAPAGGVRVLLRIARFRYLVLAAALILGSHAMHDAFAVIRWTAAGVSPSAASMLWALAVLAEVVVFFALGPRLITRLTPAGAIALAAVAGMVRWAVMAQTSALPALVLVQPLHGITFALLHLACMRLIAGIVPAGLEATAQAVYGTLGIGAATALLTFASGFLYAWAGAQAFWVMGVLCAAALPLAFKLRQ